jgi:hypothetical protein
MNILKSNASNQLQLDPSLSNLNIKEKMSQYRNIMNRLIIEKDGLTKDQINIKSEKYIRLFQLKIDQKFFIQGDQSFQDKILQDVKNICQLKPGRRLIKALLKCDNLSLVFSEGRHEIIQHRVPGEEKFIEVRVEKVDGFDYNSLSENGLNATAKQSRYVRTAHELIHALHAYTNNRVLSKSLCTDYYILKDMDNLEEQHTIIGFNQLIVSKKEALDKFDVLCENAFLLALHLPPRIDHQDIIQGSVQEQPSLDVYYEWLEKQLIQVQLDPNAKLGAHERALLTLKQNGDI